jgi:outer membrane protein assembly factor BamB/tetratricopeptide (TPR) repeat protein
MSRIRIFISAIALLSASSPAQDEAAQKDVHQVPVRAATDTYVDDSFEAEDLLKRLAALESDRNWFEAARLVDRVYDVHARHLVRAGDGLYESVAHRLHRMVSHWPTEGAKVYRSLWDDRAAKLFAKARDRHDAGALLGLLDRYCNTSPGPRIAEAASELALESGRFGWSAQACEHMLAHDEIGEKSRAEFAARLAVTEALRGRESSAEAYLSRHIELGGDGSMLWAGRHTPIAPLIRSLASQVRATDSRDTVSDWPEFGGDASRNRPARFEFDTTALLWRFDEFPRGALGAWTTASESSAVRSAIESGKLLNMNPIAGLGLIYFHDAHGVWALRSGGGTRAWSYRTSDEDVGRIGSGERTVADWYAPTLSGDRLYACLGGETASYYGYETASDSSSIVCLDARTGFELWRVDRQQMGSEFAKMVFGPAPLVSDGSLFVIARRQRTSGFEDCYLLRFNADTGQLIHSTHLGSASTGGFGYRRSTFAIAAMVEDTVYLATNLGTVAAISARAGFVRWLRTYEREAESTWRGVARSSRVNVNPWHYDPVLCSGDRIACKPSDAPVVLILDRHTGSVIHAVDTTVLSSVQSLLGFHDGKLYGVGDEAFCYDVGAARMVWTSPLPADSAIRGRGALASGSMLVPTATALCSFDMNDGSLRSQEWGEQGAPGNLLALRDQIIVAGYDRVSAYGRKSDVWARLRKAISSRPDDPSPALDLAEIAFRTGEREAAVSALAKAIERVERDAGRLDPSVRSRVFKDCLWFARSWPAGSDAGVREITKLFENAGRMAVDTLEHIEYRLRFAQFLAQHDKPARAANLYQQILADRSLRTSVINADHGEAIAGVVVRRAIAKLIRRHGRSVFEKFDAEADTWLQAARSTRDTSLLDRIAATIPNARAAPDALLLAGELLREQGRPLEAARAITTAVLRYRDRTDRPNMMRLIADCYADAGSPELSWQWLTKGVREYPQARIRLEDGTSVSLAQYRAKFAAARELAEVRRPRFSTPIGRAYTIGFSDDVDYLEPTLPASSDSDWSRVYVRDGEMFRAYDARTGVELWPAPFSSPQTPELLLATADVVIVTTPHRVFGLDASTGRSKWTIGERPADLDAPGSDPEDFASFFGHAYHGGRLVSVRDDAESWCVDIATGQVIWRRRLDHKPIAQPQVHGKWLTTLGSAKGKQICSVLDLDTGATRRDVELPSSGHVVRTHVTPDATLLIVSSNAVQAVDVETGLTRWRSTLEGTAAGSTVSVDLDGIYLSDDASHIRKVNIDDGAILWESESLLSLGMRGVISLRVAGQLLLITDRGPTAIDAVDGRTLWSGSAAIVDAARFVGLTDRDVVVVDVPNENRDDPVTVYLFDHTSASGPKRENGVVVPLDTFPDVRHVSIRDDAIILVLDKAIIAWSTIER